MLESVKINDELGEARLDIKRLSVDASVDYGYLRKLAAGSQGAGPERVASIARGLLVHAVRLLRVAERLLAGSSGLAESRRAGELAEEVERSFNLGERL